jgi:hypothetical protein
MLTARRRMIALAPLVFASVGACLVFDGLKATVDGGGATDAAEDRTARNDGRGADVAPVDERRMDAARGDGPSPQDAPGSDTGVPPSDGGISNGVVCGGQLCAGGPSQKCCAHGGGPMNLSWGYPSKRCNDECSAAGKGGYYAYECDDDDDCKTGMVCCGHGTTPPPFGQSMCHSACTSQERELCQPNHGCTKDASCEPADGEYLPPGYYWCK